MIKTRIAPSPTGFPHIGTIYQALFDFAFARRHNGKFFVRIEDTDKARFVAGAEEKIFESLDWFGLTEDESTRKGGDAGPYRQSERLELYKKYAHALLESGHAYICNKTPDELEALRQQKRLQKLPPIINTELREQKHTLASVEGQKFVIRLKVPQDRKIIFNDGVRGEIVFDSNLIDDQVILKSDGFPTYHLAVVVDDHLMGTTHVLRGEEWINSTPKHLLLYEYFGWEPPKFYHTSLIRNMDKSKMSKRHGHASVDWYRQQGFLPQAILNYLSLLAWTHPEQKEIFDMQEFIKVMDFKDIKALGPLFDLKKLEWLNGQYIMAKPKETLQKEIVAYLQTYAPEFYTAVMQKQNLLPHIMPLISERIKKFSEFEPLCKFYFVQPQEHEVDLSTKSSILQATTTTLQELQDWSAVKIGEAMQSVAAAQGVKNSEYFGVMRVAVTGRKISPPLNESMELLGKDEVLKRLSLII